MKATELMIGDWVLWLGNPCRVDLPLLDTEFDGREQSENVQPISLTAEILEKNGWRPCNNKAWLGIKIGCDEIYIMLGKNYAEVEYRNMCYNPEDNAEVNFGANFEYPRAICVHELQHILRMYDIDKEIVL